MRLRLYFDQLGQIPILIPPYAEQLAIVRFLDCTNQQLERAIRAKWNVISLLNEQKQVIIHGAVTRGLDQTIALKPSAIPWLGNVPEHWQITRLGRLIDLTTGFAFKSEGFSQNEADVRLLRGINVSPDRVRWGSVVRWSAAEAAAYSSYALSAGDIVLGMDRPVINSGTRVAKIREEDVPSLLLQRVARIKPKAGLNDDYLFLLLRGRGFSDYIAPIFTGVSVPHLSPDQICDFQIPFPPLDEQQRIAKLVLQNTKQLDFAIENAHQEIALLREYRTRLIADIVSGKLDVREKALRLPDVAPDVGQYDSDLDLDAETAECLV